MTRHGVLAVEMEAAELYTVAARYGVRALAVLTISDHLLTGEACRPRTGSRASPTWWKSRWRRRSVRLKRDLAGRSVGAVGLGCMSFGGIYGGTDEDESFACLAEALALGVDHWDVAEVYGNGVCESVIGRFLAQTRAEVSIATKAGIYAKPSRHFRNDAEALRRSLEGSLTRLGRDRVELFYIHRREAERPVEEVMETLVGFIEEGLIGGIGLSEVAPATLRRASAVHPVAAVQSEYSLWTRQPELGMLQACAELGTTFVAFSPVGRGIFADRFPDPRPFPRAISGRSTRVSSNRTTPPTCRHRSVPGLVPRAGLVDIRRRGGMDPASGRPCLPIPGTRSATHIRDLAQAAEIALTPDDLADIARLLPARLRPWRALCGCPVARAWSSIASRLAGLERLQPQNGRQVSGDLVPCLTPVGGGEDDPVLVPK
jgi:aryl-alcohol dehydrogenase-like predicted oxidoreductase